MSNQNKLVNGLVWAFSLILTATAGLAQAEQLRENDEYIVYYSALNSIIIQPDIAKAYGLQRSRQRGLLNISVQRKMPDGSNKPVMSQLKGYASHLSGSEIPLEFNLVTEGKAIYYLAQFPIRNGDELRFDIVAKPTPDADPIKIRFSQDFYTE